MEIVTIWRPLPKPLWVKSDNPEQHSYKFSAGLIQHQHCTCQKKKSNNKQASVSRICSYLLSLFLYTASTDYICQVFATREALRCRIFCCVSAAVSTHVLRPFLPCASGTLRIIAFLQCVLCCHSQGCLLLQKAAIHPLSSTAGKQALPLYPS